MTSFFVGPRTGVCSCLVKVDAKQMAVLQEQLMRAQSEMKRKDEEHVLELQQERSMLLRTSAELQVSLRYFLFVFSVSILLD